MSEGRLRRLRDVATICGGGTPKRSEQAYFGGNIDWVTPSDLPSIGRVAVLGTVREALTSRGLRESSATLLPSKTVLFSSRATIGKIAIADRPCATNQGFVNLIPNADLIDSWYLAYCLAWATPEISSLAGETTYKEISRGKLAEFQVPVPPVGEQRRIVAQIQQHLGRVEEIERLQHEIWKEAASLEWLLLQSIEPSDSCVSTMLGAALLESQNGRSIRSDGNSHNGNVLTLSAVHSLDLDFNKRKSVKLDDETASKFQVRPRDVFVSRSNTRGLVGLSAIAGDEIPPRTIYPDLLIRLKPDETKLRSRYLALALRFPIVRRQLRERAQGTSQSMVKISGAVLRTIEIPIPSLDEQDRLVEVADTILSAGEELFNMVQDGDALDALPKSILRKAFAGEL